MLDWLNPSFLRNLDRFLLLNYRLVWVSKVHYVLFYGLLAAGASSLFIFWLPISPSNLPSPALVATLFSIFVIVPFTFWVYKQIAYNIEKEFGQRFPFMEHSRWVLNMICIAVFALMPVVGAWFLQQKIARLINDKELIEDINKLNQGNPYFPTSYYSDNVFIETQDETSGLYPYQYDQFTPYQWQQSSLKYEYNWFNAAQLQKSYDSRRSESQHLRAITDYMGVMQKYGFVVYESPLEILERYQKRQINEDQSYSKSSWIYQKNELKSVFSKLVEAKEGTMIPMNRHEFWTIIFFMVFMASGLLVIYKSVSLKDTLISIVSFVAVMSLLGLFSAFANELTIFGADKIFLVSLLGAYAFVLFQGLSILSASSYSRFRVICLILANVGSPFIIMLLSELVREITGRRLFGDGDYGVQIEFWLGIFAYFVAFMPLFRNLYMRSQALPKS